MVFHGFQKMTLLDFPERMACTLFTGGCNFRCPFCHNALLVTELSNEDTVDEAEVLAFLKKRAGILDGVCVTGGEPLMHPELRDFLRQVKALGYAVKLDTNGSFPDRLKALAAEELLDYVAMDLKNAPDAYAETVGGPAFDMAPVEESIDFLMSGKVDFEFRTTVVAQFHTPERIEAAARRIAGAPRYFLQNFVDSGNLIGDGLCAVSREVLDEMCARARAFVPNTQLRGV